MAIFTIIPNYTSEKAVQALVDTAQKIVFDRRKVVGQTISRSQRIKSAKRNSANPFVLTVTPRAYIPYEDGRQLVEGIMLNDRYTEFQVKLGGTTKTEYLNKYQGDYLTVTQAQATTITNFTLTSVTLTAAHLVPPDKFLFKAGDWIQPLWSRYPYIITENVPGNNAYVYTVTVHRSLISSESTTITNATILVGTNTTMRVVISELPTYEIGLYKQMNWSGDFTLVEKII